MVPDYFILFIQKIPTNPNSDKKSVIGYSQQTANRCRDVACNVSTTTITTTKKISKKIPKNPNSDNKNMVPDYFILFIQKIPTNPNSDKKNPLSVLRFP